MLVVLFEYDAVGERHARCSRRRRHPQRAVGPTTSARATMQRRDPGSGRVPVRSSPRGPGVLPVRRDRRRTRAARSSANEGRRRCSRRVEIAPLAGATTREHAVDHRTADDRRTDDHDAPRRPCPRRPRRRAAATTTVSVARRPLRDRSRALLARRGRVRRPLDPARHRARPRRTRAVPHARLLVRARWRRRGRRRRRRARSSAGRRRGAARRGLVRRRSPCSSLAALRIRPADQLVRMLRQGRHATRASCTSRSTSRPQPSPLAVAVAGDRCRCPTCSRDQPLVGVPFVLLVADRRVRGVPRVHRVAEDARRRAIAVQERRG